MVHVLSPGGFFFLFCYHAFIVSGYKKPGGARAMEQTKPIRQNQGRLYLCMEKIKHPQSIGKVPPT